MGKIDNKLKKFLVMDARDPAYKVNSKKFIDLTLFINKNTLVEFLSNDSITEIKTNTSNSNINVNKIKESNSVDELQQVLDSYGIDIGNLNRYKSTFNQKDTKEIIYDNVQKKINDINGLFKKIKNESDQKKEIYGVQTLYLYWYFLNGMDSFSKYMNSGIICYPISIDLNKNEIKIKKEGDCFVNPKLLQHLSKTYNFSISDDILQETFNNDVYKFIGYFQNELENKITSFQKTNSQISKFIEINKDDNKLQINNCSAIVLSQPLGGSIKKDIEKMLEMGIEDPFGYNVDLDWKNRYEELQIKNDDLIEINRPLNIYQKYAIQSALRENTLIYGPPGTGKSEVIASIIANVVYKGKTILMSSEKQAALDVVLDRIGVLSKLCLFIHNSNNKELFYNCLKEIKKLLFGDEISPRSISATNSNYSNLKKIDSFYTKISDFHKKHNIYDLYEKIDFDQYDSETTRTLLNQLNRLIKNKNVDIQNAVEIINSLKELYEIYNNEFNFLLKTNFTKYDNSFFNNFIQFDNEIITKKEFWFLILNKNTLKNKIGFLDKLSAKKFNLEVDASQLFRLFSELSNINFVKSWTRADISFFTHLFKVKNIKEMIVIKEFDSFLIENNYHEPGQLQKTFKMYIDENSKKAKNNASIILENYVSNLKDRYSRLNNEDKKRIIECLGKAELQRKWDVNKIISKFRPVFKFLFPIWILSPEKACILLQLKENIFDYGIYDESSQMFVENSYPLIYRCKINVVAGDPNQMPPSNWFNSKVNDDEDEDDIELSESLLEKAESSLWPTFYLKNHYRSKHSDLISFSNEFIYNNELIFYNRNGFNDKSIVVENVKGSWLDNINPNEASKIIDIIQKNYKEFEYKKILIVSFNKKQQEYIQFEFEKRLFNTNIYKSYSEGNIKFRNLENVQGDEADIVIFSIAYGPNANGKVLQNFGVLSKNGGRKFLNVAITRAKEKMIIVKSINSNDVANTINENTRVFKEFIAYVDRVSSLNQEKINELSNLSSNQFDSSFEENVFNYISKRIDPTKFKLFTQYKIGKKRIDMIIVCANTNKVLLGIEVDGFHYHSGHKKTLEDLDRQLFLENLGYKIFRIKEFDWLMRKNEILNQIMNQI